MAAIRRLFFDIETSRNLVATFSIGREVNIGYHNIRKERAIICIGYKWQGDRDVTVLNWSRSQSDRAMLGKFSKIIQHADECVGHNMDRFDFRWIRTRCLINSLPPIYEPKIVDTLKWARRYFRFNSNRLDYLAKILGVGCKIRTEEGLWDAIEFDKSTKALAAMRHYCGGDVKILERVFDKLVAWCAAHTHAGVLAHNDKWSCPRCASVNVGPFQRCVTASGTQQMKMKCRDCGGYYRISDSARRAHEETKPPAKAA